MKNNRLVYIDVIKAICAIWILISHFLTDFSKEIHDVLYNVVNNFTGTYCVAMFLVISGYLFARKYDAKPIDKNTIIKRYLRFSISFFLASIAYVGAVVLYGLLFKKNINIYSLIFNAFNDSFLYPRHFKIVDYASAVKYFLIGYVICFFTNNLAHKQMVRGIIVIMSLILHEYWIAAFLIGTFIFDFENKIPDEKLIKRTMYNRYCNFVLFVIYCITFRIITVNRLVYTIFASLLFLLIVTSDTHQKILSFIPLAKIGSISLELLIIQKVVYKSVMQLIKILNISSGLLIGLIISIVLTIIASFILQKISNSICSKIYEWLKI